MRSKALDLNKKKDLVILKDLAFKNHTQDNFGYPRKSEITLTPYAYLYLVCTMLDDASLLFFEADSIYQRRNLL